MPKHAFEILLFSLWLSFHAASLSAADWSLERTKTGYHVNIDETLFAGYQTDFRGTPIIWPIIGPTGQEMTRAYPMVSDGASSEKTDHPHHRSLWFNHGEVNGEDYWTIQPSMIKHKRFAKAEKETDGAVLVTENEWISKAGAIVCTDQRTMRFGMHNDCRFIDFDVTVTAAADTVVFGDTKEGSFGLRVPGQLDGDGLGRKQNKHPAGTIINAEGLKGDDAWGKPSPWVDYFGELDSHDVAENNDVGGKTVGIAIMNHPSSFRYPTYWHVRTYGLFAANPFGLHDFDKNHKEDAGTLTLEKGESFTLRYRVVFHRGTPEDADLPKMFKEYSAIP